MDIIIICMNQAKEMSYLTEGYYLNKMFTENQKTYESDIYIMCNSINGSLYEVYSFEQYKDNDIIAGTYDIVDTIEQNTRDMYIILDEKDRLFLQKYQNEYANLEYSYESIYFLNNHETKFKKLIKHITSCSKTNSCLVLFRKPLESPEKIVGPISIDKFFEMVKQDKIYTNVEYIIKE